MLEVTKLKAFANKLNIARMMISLPDRVENTVRKEENPDHQHLLHFQQYFPNPSSLGSLKDRIVWQRVKSLPQRFQVLITMGKKLFENMAGKSRTC